ncbi:ATP-binding cassette sub-family C member 3 [Pteronotus mesoamericanus]|uniref:ATP-binding cassette sub-family C member 3 n=1 Tax=Pteronotus mesoamericanus TaxID=1884717 RepID=UPI0023EAA503|nr:ATP-binding cassette sub-family C member 3 [Pteronotus parnellii mesoamericanus]
MTFQWNCATTGSSLFPETLVLKSGTTGTNHRLNQPVPCQSPTEDHPKPTPLDTASTFKPQDSCNSVAASSPHSCRCLNLGPEGAAQDLPPPVKVNIRIGGISPNNVGVHTGTLCVGVCQFSSNPWGDVAFRIVWEHKSSHKCLPELQLQLAIVETPELNPKALRTGLGPRSPSLPPRLGPMDTLCGSGELGSKFWDSNLSVYTDNPDLTSCFQNSLLAWIPCIYLWAALPCYLFYLQHRHQGYIVLSHLSRLKTALGVLLWCISWADLFYSFHGLVHGWAPAPIFVVTPLVVGVTMLLATLLIQYERLRGVQSSGVLIIFWFLCVVCAVIPFRSKILSAVAKGKILDPFRFTTFYIYFALVLFAFILSCFKEKPPLFSPKNVDPNPCPEADAGFLSRLSFWWFTKLAILGYRRPLEEQDLWSLNEENRCEMVVQRLLEAWKKQQKQAAGHRATAAAGKTVSTESEELLGRRRRPREPSFLQALLATFGPGFLISTCFMLVQSMLAFINPQLLSILIRFISNPTAPTWWGILVAVLMFVCSVIQTLIMQQCFQYIFVIGLRLRTGIIGVIYRKALVITNSVRRESTVGEMVNLISVDAQHFMDLVTFLHLLWSGPLQIILAIYFLWQNLGPSILAGVALLVLLIPFNGLLAKKTRDLEVEQMKCKDLRIKLMSEILGGIKVLKLYAWEPSLLKQVEGIRQSELRLLRRAYYLYAISVFIWICTPFLVTLITLGVYVSVDPNNVLDAEKAFVSVSLFNILKNPLGSLSQLISGLTQTSVSLKRIQHFLSQDELDPQCVERKTITPGYAVIIDNGTFTWAQDLPPTLRSLNIQVPKGALVAVVGPVGCGKSSLVSALLGEMEKLEGKVYVKGSVAYVPQQAWIQNCTLQGNVLFGRALDPKRYQRALEACALLADLDVLPGGDKTEIGEKGINLSGGQRQRVSLARAVYSDADVFLLDDPLSAVDSHVAKHIFDQVIGPEGVLASKTRVLVTHSISFLPQMDFIIVLANGQVSEVGTYPALLQRSGSFANFLHNYAPDKGADPPEEDSSIAALNNPEDEEVPLIEDTLSSHTDLVDNEPVMYEVQKQFTRQLSAMSLDREGPGQAGPRKHLDPAEKVVQAVEVKANETLIEEEKVGKGKVKLSVFWDYAKAMGLSTTLVMCLLYAGQSATAVGVDVWLSDWTNKAVVGGQQNHTSHRLSVYATLGILQGLLVVLSSIAVTVGSLRAARLLHQALLHNKMRSPQSFFDTTPSGRILNHFSKDIDIIDEVLGPTILMLLNSFSTSISTLMVIVVSTPIFAVVILPLAVFYMFAQRFYVATSRQLKRLESVSRSPIYSHFSESVTGSSIIRAYGRSRDFEALSDAKVDTNLRSAYPNIFSNRWLGVRVEFLGNCVVLFAALFAVIGRSSLSAGMAGLSVSNALQVTFSLNWILRMLSDLESNIVAVERVKEYSKTETEAPWVVEGSRPPAGWPMQGEVEFRNYSARYRPGLDLVLKDLSLRVHGGEKVGIVGRTGAGKSSMTLCLFRILEAAEGEIRIDGLNIADIGLHDLRSRLTIIPQDPVLFSGTLRMNLDPFGNYSEEDIWRALELSHLHTFVNSQPAGLDFECSEGGENLSVGQRQLVCLARALLRKSRILVLDEATAAIDLETDDFIQATIRTQFETCTVLTIAHRLNTIMDYTRVLVLDKGTIAEFDSPTNLIAARGIFYGMARDAGLA